MEYRERQVVNGAEGNGKNFQHSLKMRCASITSLEVMEVKRLRTAGSILLLSAQNSAEDSDASSDEGDAAVHLALMMDRRIKKLVGVRRVRLRIIPPKIMTVEALDEDYCKYNLRFLKADLPSLMKKLEIPDFFRLGNRGVHRGEKGFLLLLRRMAFPGRWTDLEMEFGLEYSTLSRLFNTVLRWMNDNHSFRINNYLNFWRPYMHMLERAVRRKGVPDGYQGINSFIDGTVRACAVPSDGPNRIVDAQREFYSGHKRKHGFKFQSVMLPNGMIMDLFGPVVGRRHDSALLTQSGLNNRILTMLQPLRPCNYYTYGDAAYPEYPMWLKKGGRNHQGAIVGDVDGAQREAAYRQLSNHRICVEWGFGKITSLWGFLDHPKNLKVFLQPIATMYRVMGFLTNCHTTLYGSETTEHFECRPPTLKAYLSGVSD